MLKAAADKKGRCARLQQNDKMLTSCSALAQKFFFLLLFSPLSVFVSSSLSLQRRTDSVSKKDHFCCRSQRDQIRRKFRHLGDIFGVGRIFFSNDLGEIFQKIFKNFTLMSFRFLLLLDFKFPHFDQ
jgi:hypothetical protein